MDLRWFIEEKHKRECEEDRRMNNEQLFLNESAIVELTGYRNRHCQRRWCANNGVIFKLRNDGTLVILCEHIRLIFGVHSDSRKSAIDPDFSSLQ
jgi:hypothetical protein